MTTVEHPKMPPIKGVIRMFSEMNGYITKHPTVENCYKYSEIDYMDMKGKIPIRLMNMVLGSETGKEMGILYNSIR